MPSSGNRPVFARNRRSRSHPADRTFHAALARFSGGISPIALLLAYTDWLSHLAASPQRQLEISQEAVLDAQAASSKLRGISSRPDQGPWSLIKPQAAGPPLRAAGMGSFRRSICWRRPFC